MKRLTDRKSFRKEQLCICPSKSCTVCHSSTHTQKKILKVQSKFWLSSRNFSKVSLEYCFGWFPSHRMCSLFLRGKCSQRVCVHTAVLGNVFCFVFTSISLVELFADTCLHAQQISFIHLELSILHREKWFWLCLVFYISL